VKATGIIANDRAVRKCLTLDCLIPQPFPEAEGSVKRALASDESRMITGTTIAADGGKSTYLKVM
jgi:hypothetical protein